MSSNFAQLIAQVEDEFGVSLPEGEAGHFATVGGLYEAILSRVGPGESNRLNQVFYRLRAAMISCLGAKRMTVKASTKLAPLMPKVTRKAAWKCLAEVSEFDLPKLRHPRWARDVIRTLSIGVALGLLVVLIRWANPGGLYLLLMAIGTPFVAFLTLGFLYAATPFLARELRMRTVGELARMVVSVNLPAIEAEEAQRESFNPEEVWRRLASIVCMELDLDEVTLETPLPDDRLID